MVRRLWERSNLWWHIIYGHDDMTCNKESVLFWLGNMQFFDKFMFKWFQEFGHCGRGCSAVVARSLCMWKAPGSIPGISITMNYFCFPNPNKKMNVKFSKTGLWARGVKNKISQDVDIVLTWYLRWESFMRQKQFSQFFVYRTLIWAWKSSTCINTTPCISPLSCFKLHL